MTRHPAKAMRHRGRGAPHLAQRRSLLEPIGLLLIFLTTFLVYLPALNGAQLWDDDANITAPDLQSWRGLYRIWFEPGSTQQYYPLLHSAFWLEHKLWGDAVLGYHLINVFWHVLSVSLLYLILKRLKIPGALFAAAIFAVHPVMVESVAWITEQKNTLSTVFYLSAILVYLQFDQSRKWSHYLAALGLFVLALCSKTVVVTLPAALLVIFWWQRGTLSWRRDGMPLVPFFVVAGLAGLITCWVEWNYVGATGADFQFSFFQRLLLAGRAVWFYLGKLFWPVNLIFIYPRWTPDTAEWWQWIFPIAAIALTVILWAIRKRWRAPLAAWLFYCGTLLPMLPFVNQYVFRFTFVSDHFQYIASLGMIVLAAASIALGIKRLPRPTRGTGLIIYQLVLAVLCIQFLGTLAVLSWQRSHLYVDVVALYQPTIAQNPGCWMAQNNLGFELARRGNLPAAMELYRAAIKLKPDYAQAFNNLGEAYLKSGQLPEAIETFQAAVRLTPIVSAYSNLVQAYVLAKQPKEAVATAQKAIELAQSSGHPETESQIQEWLKQYQVELQQKRDPRPPGQP